MIGVQFAELGRFLMGFSCSGSPWVRRPGRAFAPLESACSWGWGARRGAGARELAKQTNKHADPHDDSVASAGAALVTTATKDPPWWMDKRKLPQRGSLSFGLCFSNRRPPAAFIGHFPRVLVKNAGPPPPPREPEALGHRGSGICSFSGFPGASLDGLWGSSDLDQRTRVVWGS